MLRAGMFLQDRYEIIELIGSGGMSDVYKAKCHKLNRMVAIKVLKEEFSDDVNFVSKFKMEAQAAAGLSHPNIVNVYDVVDEADIHYIVMELIEGITLKSYIMKKESLEAKEAVGIAIQVAQGIAAAHEQNIIHRDIKPQNMIISKDGKVKVADFGIARAATSQTISSAAMGSVHYISPEQARGGYSDARSDIYSLGITIYEMVTGRLPFEGDNTVTVALAHLEEPITRPSMYNSDIPIGLENIILKCTEKSPDRRYHNAGDVISDLRKVLLNPNENFVTMTPLIDDSETITISPKELESIQKGQKTYTPTTRNSRVENDVNPKLEKLMATVGVIVAILIVIILILVFAKLGGLFNSGSGKKPTVSTEVSQNAESTLKDTEVFMPEVLDLPQDIAENKLKESTLVMKVAGYEDSDDYPKGYVMRQENEAGSIVSKYSSVNVIISNGSDKIDLTQVTLAGLDATSAKTLLENKHLLVALQEEANETVPLGKVIRYEPQIVKIGDTVTLYVSEGPAPTMKGVPQLLNVTEDVAIGYLVDINLVPGQATTEFHESVPAGYVMSQEFPEGTLLPEGSSVSYVVSKGPEPAAKRYIASISEVYNLSSLIGPGAMDSSVNVMIRLEQTVNGAVVHQTLMEARTLSGQTQLPIEFRSIEGAPGVETGEVQVVDVDSGNVIKTYPVTFFPLD